MDDIRWEKLAAIGGGALFVILILLQVLLPGAPPALGDPAEDYAKWFGDNNNEIRIGVFLGQAAAIPILLWLGSLWRTLRRAEDGNPRLTVVAATGLVVGGALAMVGSAILANTAIRFDEGQLDAEGARLFYGLASMMFASAGFGFAVLVAAVALLALRTGVFPRWFGMASGVLAFAWVVAGAGVGTIRTAFTIIGLVTLLVWLVWILAVSAFIWRQPATMATT